jgi:predicted MFS family arabinose efflux permease
LNLGFFIVGGFAAILVGYLTDKVNRRNLFVLVVLIGEFSCFCTLFVKDYWGLFATRAVTGISIGGSNPLIMSMIGDMFDDQSRGRAISFISIMLSLGIALGQSVAGFIGPADALGWRAPFVVIASPTFILAPIYWFTTKDPPRGGKEKAVQEAMQGREILTEVYAEKMDVTKLKLLLKNKTALIAFIQGIPGSIPWGILLVYLQDFLVQDIGPQIEGGISVQQSTIVVLTFGFGSGVGVILGGILADKYWKRDPRLVPLIMSVTTGIGALPIFGLINAPPLSIAMYAGLTLPAGLLATITGTAIRTVLMNVTLPETRGTAFAFHTLFDDIGKGLGPFWVSLLIAGAGGHRVPAFNFGMCGWLVCSALLFVMCFTVLGDLRKLELATQAAMDRRQMNDSEGSALGSNAGIKATDGPQHESTNPRVAPMNDEEAMQEKQREQSSRKSVSEVGVV